MSHNKLDLMCLQAASEAFATERIPDNWFELSEDEQNQWLDDHRYGPFENDLTDEFFGLIEDHSQTIKRLMSDVLDFAEIGIIQRMINDDLPLEPTDLNFTQEAISCIAKGVKPLSVRNIQVVNSLKKSLN